MIISGLSGNEIYCLSLKGFLPGEVTVGNSVRSLGLAGGFGAFGKSLTGGEITEITSLISEGRHAAIQRMEAEAQQRGAVGVTGVASELRTFAGYTEFLSQGTGVHAQAQVPQGQRFFSTSASGVELYCHLDAGYQPLKFVMGNVAYALGIGRGLTGGLRQLAQGEVQEFSQMYNGIRHTALQRLQHEAASVGANAVVDLKLQMLPYGPGTVELLITGTAAWHPRLSAGPVQPHQVVTSELTGQELWNLATMGYSPIQLVTATSVYSLGMAQSIGAMFKGLSRGELPEVTALIYKARENCMNLMRQEAHSLGAEHVVGNKLIIKELQPGLIEIMAVGTAIRRMENIAPHSPQLIPQAVIVDRDNMALEAPVWGLGAQGGVLNTGASGAQASPAGCLIAIVLLFICSAIFVLLIVFGSLSR
jgi:uncharacterized protein YbjQ (UPF0145 family)